MVKVGSSNAGGGVVEEGSGEEPIRPSREEEASPPDPNSLAAGAAVANFRLRRLEDSITPQDNPANDPSLTRVGALNVGDRYASAELNSPATADAARRGIAGTAHLDIVVPNQPPPAPVSPPPPSAPAPAPLQPTAFYSTSSGRVSFPLQVGGGEGEEELLIPPPLRSRPRSTPRPSSPAGSPSAPPAPSGGGPVTQRFVFDVRDVHSMGGTSSSLSIRDGAGNMVARHDLPPGDSRLTIDLPPGAYTVEAQSGSRSVGGSGGDQLDNFRVEVFSGGNTPSGEGGGGGGSGSGSGGSSGGGSS